MPRKLRVLQVTVGFTVGGTELLIRDLSRLLDGERFACQAACLKGPGPVGKAIRSDGIEVHALGGRSRLDPTVPFRLYGLLRSGKFDIVHSHLFRADLPVRIAGRLARVPVIVNSQHDTDLWMRWWHKLLGRWTLPLADKVVAVSQSVLEDTVQRLRVPGERYTVIHNGIDLAPYSPGRDPKKFRLKLGLPREGAVVGFAGRLLDGKKGVSILIEAFSRLSSAKGEKATLAIAGDGPDRARLKGLAEILGVAHRTHFLGPLTDMPRFYFACDLVVVPSLYEGFGLVCLEAMAACRPVVASRVGGIPEVVAHDETGILVPPGDREELAAAIDTYLENPELCRSHGDAGRRRVKEMFTIRKMVRAYEALYLELFEQRQARKAART